MTDAPKKLRGLAKVDPARRRQIASEGGRAVHELGRGHQYTSEEARIAGRKGGLARSAQRKAQTGGGGTP